MNREQFESQVRENTVLVDFGAEWCSPCRAMKPVLKALHQAYQGKAKILKIDIDSHRELATDYMVQSIPTFILFKDGHERKRLVGLQSISALEKGLDELLIEEK